MKGECFLVKSLTGKLDGFNCEQTESLTLDDEVSDEIPACTTGADAVTLSSDEESKHSRHQMMPSELNALGDDESVSSRTRTHGRAKGHCGLDNCLDNCGLGECVRNQQE